MYLDFYNLKAQPFNITPDPRYLFFSRYHREAFEHIIYGITQRKGFIQITGEVGAGKSTICRAVLEELDENYHTALILNPVMTGIQLLRSVLREFDLDDRGNDRVRLTERLNSFLLDCADAEKDVVLLIDEAQDMSPELLEQVRLLSNLETDDQKLLQIVLVGQPELKTMLSGDAPASAQPAHHRPLPPRPDPQRRDRGLYPSPPPGGRIQRTTEFYDRRLPRHSPPLARCPQNHQRGLRQGAALRLCRGARSSRVLAASKGHPGTRREATVSLIGDALRKARQEAADRESDRKGVLFSARISDSPSRSNLGLGLALGAVIAVAATVAGGSAVWWLLNPGETTQTGTIGQLLRRRRQRSSRQPNMPGGSLPSLGRKIGFPQPSPSRRRRSPTLVDRGRSDRPRIGSSRGAPHRCRRDEGDRRLG